MTAWDTVNLHAICHSTAGRRQTEFWSSVRTRVSPYWLPTLLRQTCATGKPLISEAESFVAGLTLYATAQGRSALPP